MTPILNLDPAPRDPIERLMWLTGVQDQARRELDRALETAYFEARLQQRFDSAIAAGPYSRKRALAATRHENQRRGRTVRWNDKLDPTSSSYYG